MLTLMKSQLKYWWGLPKTSGLFWWGAFLLTLDVALLACMTVFFVNLGRMVTGA